MRSWVELYKKEIRSISFFALVSLLLVLAWELFLFYKSSVWPSEIIFGLSFIPFTFFPLIMLWQGYQSYRHEWKNKTIYMLMSLPRKGWQISLSKLAAAMSYYIISVLFTIFMIYAINDYSVISWIPESIPKTYIVKSIFLIAIGYILYGLFHYIISQFSCLVSRFYSRFRGIISIVVFILTNYVIYRLASIIAPIFNWIPNIPIKGFTNINGQINVQTLYINSAPIVSFILLLVLIFYFGGLLIERYLEV